MLKPGHVSEPRMCLDGLRSDRTSTDGEQRAPKCCPTRHPRRAHSPSKSKTGTLCTDASSHRQFIKERSSPYTASMGSMGSRSTSVENAELLSPPGQDQEQQDRQR